MELLFYDASMLPLPTSMPAVVWLPTFKGLWWWCGWLLLWRWQPPRLLALELFATNKAMNRKIPPMCSSIFTGEHSCVGCNRQCECSKRHRKMAAEHDDIRKPVVEKRAIVVIFSKTDLPPFLLVIPIYARPSRRSALAMLKYIWRMWQHCTVVKT